MLSEEQRSSANPDDLIPFLDHMLARGENRYFWRKARATARLWMGDLTGAAADDPAYAIPARDPRSRPQEIDLTPFYNRLLVKDGMGALGKDLAELPVGRHSLDGTVFDLRGMIRLKGSGPGAYPEQITGIPIGQPCREIHVLHATGSGAEDGTPVGGYVLHYADGTRHELPIVYGFDLRDWNVVARARHRSGKSPGSPRPKTTM